MSLMIAKYRRNGSTLSASYKKLVDQITVPIAVGME